MIHQMRLSVVVVALGTFPIQRHQKNVLIRDKQKHGNGNVQAKVRANNSGQFEGTAHKNVGFRGNKGQKVHPNFAPNITILFSLPWFFSSPKEVC